VTSLGEFSPLGWLFPLGSVYKKYKIALIVNKLLFSKVKVKLKFRTKNGLGYILGDIFSKLILSPWREASTAPRRKE
jgi:hypothetical protein